jgi:hypothetical protein
MRGGSSVIGVVSPVNEDSLSGMGGGGEAIDDLSPAVLLLNLDGNGGAGFQDIVLSLLLRLPIVDARIMLFRAVRSNTFFSVKGKYSAKCVVMSSLGGR